jgi:arylsulfatase A-like enzyme
MRTTSGDDSFGGPRYDAGFARAAVAFDARSDRDLRYTTFTTAGSLAVPFDVVEEHVEQTLANRVPAGKPLFLYVNFHDTHFPYTHDGIRPLVSDVRLARQQIGPAEREALWATYANTAANVDSAIGRVLDRVRNTRGR